jgi:hypothetical protein
VLAIARAHQARQDAERLAHDTPQPETGEIPDGDGGYRWTPKPVGVYSATDAAQVVPAPAAEQALTPDQALAIARAHQARQDAERLAHDTPQPETGEIPAPATWTPPDEAA